MHLRSSIQYILPCSESLLQVLWRGKNKPTNTTPFFYAFMDEKTWKRSLTTSLQEHSSSAVALLIFHHTSTVWNMGSKWKTTFLELDWCKELPFKTICCFFLKLATWKKQKLWVNYKCSCRLISSYRLHFTGCQLLQSRIAQHFSERHRKKSFAQISF